MAVAHKYCHGGTAFARGTYLLSHINRDLPFSGPHIPYEWQVAAVRATLIEWLPVETLDEAQSSMGPVTLTFRYDLRTLMGALMLHISNSRRVKTSLDSNMRRKI